MKFFLLLLALLSTVLPTIALASTYGCRGSGFIIDIAGKPLEMKIVGNGFNTMVSNVNVTSTFDTIVSGSTLNPAATLKVVIKDSSFGSPGDSFKADVQVSSAAGIRDFTGLDCIRGID